MLLKRYKKQEEEKTISYCSKCLTENKGNGWWIANNNDIIIICSTCGERYIHAPLLNKF